MPPVFLIEGQFQDGTPHSCGMSVSQSAILHHQIHPTVSQEAVGFFFAYQSLVLRCERFLTMNASAKTNIPMPMKSPTAMAMLALVIMSKLRF